MKKIKLALALLMAVVVVIGLILALLIKTSPKQPIALLRVVDAAGKPVAGAVIRPDGLRPKSAINSGHYSWIAKNFPVGPNPVSTDDHGHARVPYPKYVFERIETGQIGFSVNHPDFAPDRPFRLVATRPPAGAPWQAWADYFWARIRHKPLIVRTDPVVLQQGATLKLLLRRDIVHPLDAQLFAQDSTEGYRDTNFWTQPERGVLMTRRFPSSKQSVRVFQVRGNGSLWFSDVFSLAAGAGRTNVAIVGLKPALAVHGQLDNTVPRPVKNGRVVAHVWPLGHKPQDSPPQWHAWTTIRTDGGFDIASLPPGVLEIVALCDGFVSTNGPGESPGIRYPQKHLLGTNDLNITIGMEPTVRLEVNVADEKGNALEGSIASASPNVRYGDWAATILLSDCYNTLNRYLRQPDAEFTGSSQPVPDFQGKTDSSGLAVIPNLPADVNEFSVEHPRFVLPAVLTAAGDQVRVASVSLVPGQTNRVSVELEPRGRSPIKQY